MRKYLLLSLTLILSLLILIAGNLDNLNSNTVFAADDTSDASDRLDELDQELEELRNKQQQLENDLAQQEKLESQYGTEIATLTRELSLMQQKILEKDLVIEKLNLEIDVLEYQITQTEEDVNDKIDRIEVLEEETLQRITSIYIDNKTFTEATIIFNSNGPEDFVKNDLYRQAIQDNTNKSLQVLGEERKELENQLAKLDEDRIQIEKDRTLLDEEKLALEKQQTLLDQRKVVLDQKVQASLNAQQNLELQISLSSEEEQKLIAERELLRQQILDQIGNIESNSYVFKGTIIALEGNTGWSTGPHLHFGVAYNGTTTNPCNYLNCSSLSSGTLEWPLSPKGVITSGYGQRAYDFHAAIDISTGGIGQVKAAHNGWVVYGTQACYDLTWVKCNGGFAKYAIVCENKNCNEGFKTIYWHLK